MTEETGPDRVRAAVQRDRGDWAGEDAVVGIERHNAAIRAAAPPDTVWYRPDGTVVGEPVPPEPRLPLRHRLAESIVCPACLRLRCSPVHLYFRLIGWCDGENMR